VKEKALSCAGLRDLRLTFSPAWFRNFVSASGLARSTAAYDGGFGVYAVGSYESVTRLIQRCTKSKNDIPYACACFKGTAARPQCDAIFIRCRPLHHAFTQEERS